MAHKHEQLGAVEDDFSAYELNGVSFSLLEWAKSLPGEVEVAEPLTPIPPFNWALPDEECEL